MKVNGFQGGYRFLSNFWPATVIYDDDTYPTVEHAYQAAKTLDVDARIRIQWASKPGDAKRMGRRIKLREDWESIKLHVMDSLLMQKFAAEPLLSKLLGTGDDELIEANTWGDTYWGVCNGVGDNHLGKLLMVVRERLRG